MITCYTFHQPQNSSEMFLLFFLVAIQLLICAWNDESLQFKGMQDKTPEIHARIYDWTQCILIENNDGIWSNYSSFDP